MTEPHRTADQVNLRNALGEACTRLRELNNSFNMARLIMQDKELRDQAGEWVKGNKEFLDRVVPLLIFKETAT